MELLLPLKYYKCPILILLKKNYIQQNFILKQVLNLTKLLISLIEIPLPSIGLLTNTLNLTEYLMLNTVYNKRNKLKLIITLRIKLKRFLKYLKLISWIRLNLIGYQNKYPEELNTILQSFELGNIFKRILFISLSIQNIETFDNGR